MPTYSIQAPDGRTYSVPGPDGATPEDVQAEVLRQYPAAAGGATANTSELRAAPPAPTFMEGVGSGLKSAAKEVLPLAGMVGGGILGAPVGGPVGAAAGGIGGYLLGKQGNDTIEALFNYLSGKPVRPASEIPGRAAQQLGEGATIEAAGAGLGWAGGKLGQILGDAGVPGFGSRATPELQAARAAAARSGVELPASAATGSRTLAAIESVPGRFPLGAQQSRDFYDRMAMGMQRAGERVAQSAGPEVGLEAAGRGIQRDIGGIGAAQDEASAGLRAAYETTGALQDEAAMGLSAVNEGAALRGAQDVAARDQRFVQGQQADAQGLIDAYLRQFGEGRTAGPNGELGGTQLGAQIQAALDAAQTEARGRIEPLYQGLRDEVSAAGSAVPMTTTKEVADRILAVEERMSGLGRRAVSRPAETASDLSSMPAMSEEARGQLAALPATTQELVIRQMGLDQGRAIDPADALELAKRLKAASRNATDDITRHSINELRTAVESDLRAWANVSGTNVGPLRQQAATAYRENIVPYFDPAAPVRKQLMDVEPEVAAQRLLSMRDPQLIQDTMRFLPPEVQNRIRASVLGGAPRDAAGFQQAMGRYSDEALQALLGPEGAQGLGRVRQQLTQGVGQMESNRAFGHAIGQTEARARQDAYERGQSGFRAGADPGAYERGQAGFRAGAEPQLAAIAGKEGSVEGLVNSLIRGGPGSVKSVEDFDAVWAAIAPETQQQVRSATLHRLQNAAVDPHTRQFSGDRFVTEWAKTPDTIWQRLLEPDQYGMLRDLTATFQQVSNYSRPAMNPSGTSQGFMALAQMAALYRLANSVLDGKEDPASFIEQLAAITAPMWGGKLLFSQGAQNWLKRPGGQGGPSAFAPLSRILGVELVPGDRP